MCTCTYEQYPSYMHAIAGNTSWLQTTTSHVKCLLLPLACPLQRSQPARCTNQCPTRGHQPRLFEIREKERQTLKFSDISRAFWVVPTHLHRKLRRSCLSQQTRLCLDPLQVENWKSAPCVPFLNRARHFCALRHWVRVFADLSTLSLWTPYRSF